MCLRRAPEKYIAGAALDRAALESVCEINVCKSSVIHRVIQRRRLHQRQNTNYRLWKEKKQTYFFGRMQIFQKYSFSRLTFSDTLVWVRNIGWTIICNWIYCSKFYFSANLLTTRPTRDRTQASAVTRRRLNNLHIEYLLFCPSM
jgi:hypothetical protein